MANWTLQHGTEIVDGTGYKVHAYHLTDNFTGLKSDIDDRLSMVKPTAQSVASGITWAGAQTFNSTVSGSGIWTLSGTVNVTGSLNLARSSDPGSPPEGMFWGNTTTHLPKYYNGTSVLTLATTTDVAAVLPTQTGNNGKVLSTNGSVPSWTAGPVFTAYNLSSNITIVNGGAWSVTHGLGAAPKGVNFWLVNLTAELGYSTGDRVLITNNQGAYPSDRGTAAAVLSGNTTTINGRFSANANVFAINHATTGAITAITAANWALQVASWA